jgi:hypothetical protein
MDYWALQEKHRGNSPPHLQYLQNIFAVNEENYLASVQPIDPKMIHFEKNELFHLISKKEAVSPAQYRLYYSYPYRCH